MRKIVNEDENGNVSVSEVEAGKVIGFFMFANLTTRMQFHATFGEIEALFVCATKIVFQPDDVVVIKGKRFKITSIEKHNILTKLYLKGDTENA